MHYEWIIVGLITIICSCSNTTCTTTTTTTTNNNNTQSAAATASVTNVDNRDIKRLWAAALQAINDAELQRVSQRRPATTTTDLTAPAPPATAQRPNSKRMKWRTNSKQLDRRAEDAMAALEAAFLEAEPRSGTYPSTEEDNHNPTYIDVRDHEPEPLPWWF